VVAVKSEKVLKHSFEINELCNTERIEKYFWSFLTGQQTKTIQIQSCHSVAGSQGYKENNKTY